MTRDVLMVRARPAKQIVAVSDLQDVSNCRQSLYTLVMSDLHSYDKHSSPFPGHVSETTHTSRL